MDMLPFDNSTDPYLELKKKIFIFFPKWVKKVGGESIYSLSNKSKHEKIPFGLDFQMSLYCSPSGYCFVPNPILYAYLNQHKMTRLHSGNNKTQKLPPLVYFLSKEPLFLHICQKQI